MDNWACDLAGAALLALGLVAVLNAASGVGP
jgi:hypothetical protein